VNSTRATTPQCCFDVVVRLILNRLTNSLNVWCGFLNFVQVGRNNGLLKRARLTDELYDLCGLLELVDKKLFKDSDLDNHFIVCIIGSRQ
jgi:hypothetical protein